MESGRPTGSQPGGATGSQIVEVRVKEENNGDSTARHSHKLKLKFRLVEHEEYITQCHQPCTVLDILKSNEKFNKLKYSDENILIQQGKQDKESIVATHFPCSCISDGESLIISCESEKVEDAQNQHDIKIHSRDKYSVFYIDTVGGKDTKTKKLFKNKAVKQFKYLCVYGEKGMTVEEALKRDGRFIDDLGDFTLSDNENPSCITECTQKVDNLDHEKFKLCLPRKNTRNDETLQENPGASNNSAVKKRGSNTEEIYEIVHQQFQDLKKWMETRFPGESYQKELNLGKGDFGKIQQSFSEVHRVRKLLKLGESVCKVVVENVCEGTGFVLFDNFILTNAHLFTGYVEGEKLKEGIDVFVFFNYEDPEPYTNYYYFLVKTLIHCSEGDLDYAILELNPDGHKPNQTTQTKKMKVPPGLLKEFGPLPPTGEACIIGHPAGRVKKMDPTYIIEKEKREEAVRDHLHPHKMSAFTVQSIIYLIKKQGIEAIMMDGSKADKAVTDNTFMYHDSSGSPVFDAHCRVFGLHTAGYVYGIPYHTDSVIEFAQPVFTIFKHFVSKLKESGDEKLLKRVEKEVKGNSYLETILNSTAADADEPADTDE